MRRDLYDDEQQAFGESFRTFIDREVRPHDQEWSQAGRIPRDTLRLAGEAGFLAMAVPEEFGGAGAADFRFNAILGEEAQRAGFGSFGLAVTLHNDICLPYFLELCNGEQRERWLPGIASGEKITAIAMTEPDAGSDLAGLRSKARPVSDGYLLDGAKTFITNGLNSELVIVAARTSPGERHEGISLVVVEEGMPGFRRGRHLEKVGMHAQDTAELFFDGCEVPSENLLGEEGSGFRYLMRNLAQERLSIAVAAVAAAQAALGWTVEHVRSRKAFGATLGSLQSVRHQLAELRTETDIAQVFIDRCILALNEGELSSTDAAEAKWWCTELQGRVVDRCVQLHGGYGYMTEYPISQAWTDARITRIYGGATEVMKEIVGRSMELGATG
jgi:alkylation response protein AidB-like acyl-CoA dehydrogenase